MDVTHPVRRRLRGITLLEMLTTLAVAVTLTAVSVPALQAFADTQDRSAAMNTLNTDLLLARHAAVSSAGRVVLCPSTNQNQCSGGYDWSKGWIVFRDRDADRHRDPDDELLSARGQQSTDLQILTSQGRQKITYHSNGGTGGSNVTFRVCDPDNPGRNRALVINISGRSRVSTRDSRGKPILCKTTVTDG